MLKISAIAATLVIAVAMPAVAAQNAQSVRIKLTGKTQQQINVEINLAAHTVCADALSSDSCVHDAIATANQQLIAIGRKAPTMTRMAANREAPKSVKIALAGKSSSQLELEINAAARTVCKANIEVSYEGCVADAVRDAHAQLRQVAQVSKPQRLASN